MPKAPISIPRSSGHPLEHCEFCGAQDSLSEKNLQQEVAIQGESYQCLVPRTVCSNCEANFSTVDQANRAIELGVVAFQQNHGLLTAAEIKEKRNGLGWTQQELAKRAHVGIASVKRWERGRQVQTSANDQTLRSTFSSGNEKDCVYIVSVTQSRFYTIGELQSFSPSKPANPSVLRISETELRPQTLSWGISDEPFNVPCHA